MYYGTGGILFWRTEAETLKNRVPETSLPPSSLENFPKVFFPPTPLAYITLWSFPPFSQFKIKKYNNKQQHNVAAVSTASNEASDYLPEDFPHLLQPHILGEFGWHGIMGTTSNKGLNAATMPLTRLTSVYSPQDRDTHTQTQLTTDPRIRVCGDIKNHLLKM